MLYLGMEYRIKKPISTHIAASILGVHKGTLWNWGKAGKIRMNRSENGSRIFDEEQLKELAPRITKERMRGFSIFPRKKPKK